MPEATAHPSEKQLSAYNLGQMSPDEATAIESHIAESEPESLKFLRKDIPDELATIVMKMLAKDPDQRHQTPADVAVVLESFARSSQNIEHQAPRQRPSTGEFMNGPGEPSANVSPMPVRRDWLLLAARALLAVSLIPVAFICRRTTGHT